MRETVNPIVLSMARKARGLSPSSLAKSASIAPTDLARVEGALDQDVPADTVDRLAEALGFHRDLLFSTFRPPISFHLSLRPGSNPGSPTVDRLEASAALRLLHIRRMVESIEIDETMPCFLTDEETSPEDIAQRLRSFWGLPRGPIENLAHIVEAAGAFIVPLDLSSPSVDALTFHYSPNVSRVCRTVFINRAAPPDQFRAILAHELGHLVMHPYRTPAMEDEAVRFAQEFLLPEIDATHHLRLTALADFISLRRYWKLPTEFLIDRAYALGYIARSERNRLRAEYNSLLHQDALPAPIAAEEPRLLPELLRMHIEDLGYTIPEIAQLLYLSVSEFQKTYLAAAPPLALPRPKLALHPSKDPR